MSCQCGCIREMKSSFNAETDLWELCLYAYDEYQKSVRFGQKKYHRYVADVLSFSVPIASHDRKDWQVHSMNISRLFELLDYRIDLVRKYFTKEEFTEEDFESMMHEFMHLEKPYIDDEERYEEMQAETGAFASVFTEQVYIGKLNSKQLSFITSFVNRIKLFTKDVTMMEMHKFFHCNLHETELEPRDLIDFAMFMDAMRSYKLIVNKWQTLIEEHCMVLTSKGTYLKRSQLSSAINSNKNKYEEKQAVFKSFAESLVGR